MDEEVDSHINRIIEAPRKELFRVQIPFALRFSLIWTLFFVIVGIAVQYFQNPQTLLSDTITNFFTTNYSNWIRSFGSFSDVTIYPTSMDFIQSLIGKGYYFLYTGGLLSLLWALLSWIIHFEFIFKRNPKPIIAPEVVSTPKEIPEKPIYTPISNKKLETEEWIDEGLRFLSERNLAEAELIYNEVRKAYNPTEDYNQKIYKRILDFYYEIMDEKSSPKMKEPDTWEG